MDEESDDGDLNEIEVLTNIEPTDIANNMKIEGIEGIEGIEEIVSSSYRYLFYIILVIILGIFLLWIVISMFSSEPPIVILNQMLNNGLEITATSDK